jgi:hypothetical protein
MEHTGFKNIDMSDFKDMDDVINAIMGEMKSSTKLTGEEAKFVNLSKLAVHYITEGAVPLVEATGTITAMFAILNKNHKWSSYRALSTAGSFIKNSTNVSLEHKTLLKSFVQEFLRIGLVQIDETGFTQETQTALGMIAFYANKREYVGIWDTCIDFILAPRTTPEGSDAVAQYCFTTTLCKLVIPTLDETNPTTFQGTMAPKMAPFTIRAFNSIAAQCVWTTPFEEDGEERSHPIRHFMTVFGMLISRTQTERIIAMKFATALISDNTDETWAPTIAGMLVTTIIAAKKYVDLTDFGVVQFLKLANGFIH